MKRVLVTGASGFIGRQTLLPLLRMGYEVHAVANRHAIASIPDITWHEANFLKESHRQRLLEDIQPSHILHLAWYVEHGQFWTAPENRDWSEATIAFAQEATTRGVTRMVFAGSSAEYEWPLKVKTVLDESASTHNPSSIYGIEKLRTWKALWQQYGDTSISLASGRLFMLYGWHEHPYRFVPSAIRAFMSRQPFKVTSPFAYRDFLDSRDAGRALAMLLDSHVNGAVNIASGNAITLGAVSRLIADIMECQHLLEFEDTPPAPVATNYVVADTSRLANEVKFQQNISLEKGLEDTISWWEHELNYQ